ncbi:helix-turn-helix domain-containing protein [Embleya hyalina]|uniref:HTH cro/C1-type domain-containing protein n=1 Tax=Embleya hyalina TaxID=516124 RepID=A0A401YUL0_9ACTN|nr:helix-turn-helix transcriptional regulator [Embleya hyalina]GCD98235.1 hypothetical protein EHYA_05938 [Embleya hyalina]
MENQSFGNLLASLRLHAGLTQTELAEALNQLAGTYALTRCEIGRYEQDRRIPSQWLPLIADVLGADRTELERAAKFARSRRRLARTGPVRASTVSPTLERQSAADEGGHVDRRSFLALSGAAAAGMTLSGASDDVAPVEVMHRLVAQFRSADQQRGGAGIYRDGARSLAEAFRWLNRSRSPELKRASAGLALSVGWLAHDATRYADARACYSEAQSIARALDDLDLEVHALCNLSALAVISGRPREGLRLAEAAQHIARPIATPWLMSLLTLREAGAWAALGNAHETDAALTTAHRHFECGRGERDPVWIAFFGSGEIAAREAQCRLHLGQHGTAGVLSTRAAHLTGNGFVRDRAIHLTRAARAWHAAGDRDAAAEQVDAVLPLLDNVASARLASRLQDLVTTTSYAERDEIRSYLARHALEPTTSL